MLCALLSRAILTLTLSALPPSPLRHLNCLSVKTITGFPNYFQPRHRQLNKISPSPLNELNTKYLQMMQIRLAQAWYMYVVWYYTQAQLIMIWHGNCSDVYWNSNPIVIPSMQSISEDLQSWTNGFSWKNSCLFKKTFLGNFKAISHLPFWFWIVIHDSSSIELYQLCVIWWRPMSGLTTAWQQISGSFMTITAWRGHLRRLMKSS